MALFGEAQNKPTRHNDSWSRIRQQILLVPEAAALAVLLVVGWATGFPPLLGLLAMLTALLFGLRLLLLALAERQLAQGSYGRADRLVRAALRLNPWSADALVLRAQVLTHQGEDEAAEQLLRSATRLYPGDSTLHSALASVLLAQGRIVEGWQIARQDHIIAINTPQVLQQRAWLALHAEDDPAKARTIIREAQPERYPPRIALPLLATLAEAQMMLGARAEAERVLTTIEEQLPACPQPQQAELLYHLGRLHTALGADGGSYFRRSVELDPAGRYAQVAWRSAVNPAA